MVNIWNTIFRKAQTPTREEIKAASERANAEATRLRLEAAINEGRRKQINDLVQGVLPKRGTDI